MAAPLGPYTPAVVANGFVYCSGQLGLDGDALAEGLQAQAHHGITNLSELLQAHGASLDTVVKTTVFLTDMNDFAAMNEVYATLFGESRPARSCVAVAALPKGAIFEIEAVATLA